MKFPLPLLLALACPLPSAASADDLPKRKPGLWRITTISPEIGMHSVEACIAEGDSIIGAPDQRCAAPEVTRADNQVVVTFSCGADNDRDVTSILFTGDFQSWYRGQSKTIAGAQTPSAARRSGFTIDAKYLGADCEAARTR